ncbi:hypothetical protein EDC52_111104 [Biostraticola tofi]|uniref:Uncharacterized protein n=1 Tax=Biostraticola tofi TaxID=466109 RepID=A0A4R3YIZ5_9GAMM|nr:hypothetical protein EDC52_111104 [Biostraticola tofi]
MILIVLSYGMLLALHKMEILILYAKSGGSDVDYHCREECVTRTV